MSTERRRLSRVARRNRRRNGEHAVIALERAPVYRDGVLQLGNMSTGLDETDDIVRSFYPLSGNRTVANKMQNYYLNRLYGWESDERYDELMRRADARPATSQLETQRGLPPGVLNRYSQRNKRNSKSRKKKKKSHPKRYTSLKRSRNREVSRRRRTKK